MTQSLPINQSRKEKGWDGVVKNSPQNSYGTEGVTGAAAAPTR